MVGEHTRLSSAGGMSGVNSLCRSASIIFAFFPDGHFTDAEANHALSKHQNFHNHVRPHQALDLKTPNEYLRNTKD